MTAVRFEIPTGACGAFWQADYGPLFCDRGKDHAGDHRTYGSRGEITWHEITDPIEAGFYRAVAESMAADLFVCPRTRGETCERMSTSDISRCFVECPGVPQV